MSRCECCGDQHGDTLGEVKECLRRAAAQLNIPALTERVEAAIVYADDHRDAVLSRLMCVPLCGAAYRRGQSVRWWHHEALCPARLLGHAAAKKGETDGTDG